MAWHRQRTVAGDRDALLATMIEASTTPPTGLRSSRANWRPSASVSPASSTRDRRGAPCREPRHRGGAGRGRPTHRATVRRAGHRRERRQRRRGRRRRHPRQPTSDLAYLSIGTGVAVGLVLDGRLRRGWRGAAGEIGHLPVAGDGPRCECGQRGCLEAVASGAAIARRWPVHDGASPAAALFDAARRGDDDAIDQRDRLVDHLAVSGHGRRPDRRPADRRARRRCRRSRPSARSTPSAGRCAGGPPVRRCSPISTSPAGWRCSPTGPPPAPWEPSSWPGSASSTHQHRIAVPSASSF